MSAPQTSHTFSRDSKYSQNIAAAVVSSQPGKAVSSTENQEQQQTSKCCMY